MRRQKTQGHFLGRSHGDCRYGNYRHKSPLGPHTSGRMLHLRKIRDYTQVIDEVRAHILDNRGGHVTAETLANMFRVRIGIIHRCLHKLNLEGLVYKKSRHYAHDTNRNPMFDGSESGWGANVYCIKEAVET